MIIVLLGALDADYRTWESTRNKNAELYRALKDKFCHSYVD